MIPMRAPRNVLSFSVAGAQFPVVNGVVQVPPPYARHALAHGFKMLEGGNADELIASDLEAALTKAQASIPLRGMKAKTGMKSLMIEGTSYVVGDDGYVEVPANMEGVAILLGCEPDNLRAGPATERVPQGDGSETKAAGTGAETPASTVPTAAEIKVMPTDELRAFLKGHGVEFLGDAPRKALVKAGTDLVEKLAKEEADAKEAEDARRAELTDEERAAEDAAKEAEQKKD
jgi:hypothetical protein